MLTRMAIGYGLQVCAGRDRQYRCRAAGGPAAPAGFGFRPHFERLRDVLALCVAAAAAGQHLLSFLARLPLARSPHPVPFGMGWLVAHDAMGALAVVPGDGERGWRIRGRACCAGARCRSP
ncbi:MAG: hypothetical protein IPH86_12635 [bacterium]|nr:hypothetical protein [bacterium]